MIKRNSALLLVSVIVYAITSSVITFLLDSSEALAITYITLIHLALSICLLVLFGIKRTLIIALFVIFSWVFYCGQMFNAAFGYDEYNILPYLNYGTNENILKSIKFYLYFQTILVASSLFFCLRNDKICCENILNFRFELKKNAIILITIGVVPKLYVSLQYLSATFSGGYSSLYNVYIPQVILSFAYLFDVGLIFVLLYFFNNKTYSRYILMGILCYEMILMLSGQRMFAVCFIIVLCLCFYYYNNIKLRFARSAAMCMFGVLFLSFLNFISKNRISGEYNLFGFVDEVTNFNLVFLPVFGEYGSALSSLVVAVQNVPDYVNYGFGITYIAALLSSIPYLVSAIDVFHGVTVYTKLFSGTIWLGGSGLGEFYYNFGAYGVMGGWIVGFLLGWCQRIIYNSKKNVGTVRLLISICLLIEIFLFIRGYMADSVQKMLILACILFAIKHFNNKNLRKIKSYNQA